MLGAQLPDRFANLRVLPASISSDSLLVIMGGFTRALGVRCAHCHVAANGVRPTVDEFALDTKETKTVARAMIRMVSEINGRHLPAAGRQVSSGTRVTCNTCHGGVSLPRPLETVLLAAYDSGGMDSLTARYRELRSEHFGGRAYDFSDFVLPTLADELSEEVERRHDGLSILRLNLEFNPQSWFTFQQMAQLQVAMGDTAAAIASLTRGLEINPQREFMRQLLARYQRK
jgi:hypothetical protein